MRTIGTLTDRLLHVFYGGLGRHHHHRPTAWCPPVANPTRGLLDIEPSFQCSYPQFATRSGFSAFRRGKCSPLPDCAAAKHRPSRPAARPVARPPRCPPSAKVVGQPGPWPQPTGGRLCGPGPPWRSHRSVPCERDRPPGNHHPAKSFCGPGFRRQSGLDLHTVWTGFLVRLAPARRARTFGPPGRPATPDTRRNRCATVDQERPSCRPLPETVLATGHRSRPLRDCRLSMWASPSDVPRSLDEGTTFQPEKVTIMGNPGWSMKWRSAKIDAPQPFEIGGRGPDGLNKGNPPRFHPRRATAR